MATRDYKHRMWNWIPQTKDVIDDYITCISEHLFEIRLHYIPEDIVILIQTDYYEFISKIKQHFFYNKSEFAIGDQKQDKVSIRLIYYANKSAVNFIKLNATNRIMKIDYSKTDVLIDLKNNTALFHGPQKFGFVKGLLLGLLSVYQNRHNMYGLHSALIKKNDTGILFAGAHDAGKSSMSIITALTEESTEILSDDWVMCKDNKQMLFAKPIELNAYLNPKTVSRIISAVPSKRVVNKQLADSLERFVLFCESKLNNELGEDQRMCLGPNCMCQDENRYVNIKHIIALIPGNNVNCNPTNLSELVDIFTDFSFHIPFHSRASRVTLEELKKDVMVNSIDKDLIETVYLILKREKDFWINNDIFKSLIVFNTSDDNLWEQFCLLKELINNKSI